MVEYREIRLGDYIKDIASGPFGSNLKVECFVPFGFPIIDGANLMGTRVTDNITKYVTEEKARSLARSIAKRHDVIVTISGTLGQISYIPLNSKFSEYLCSQRQFRVTFDEKSIDVEYLVYYFHTKQGQKKILSFANYVGVPALAQPLPNFKGITINIPPIDYQNKISSFIGFINDKIALNTRMNAELEAMAKQLYDYWFVQFDFPDENGNPYRSSGGKMVYNSTLKRAIPAGWEVKEISDITEIKSGYPFKSENMNEYKGKYKIVTIRNVQENNLDLSNISYTDIIPDNIKSYCILKEKDILISLTGNVGRTCLVYENGLLLNQRVGLVQPKNSNVPWCYSIFKDKSIRTAVENWANGCAQANVSPLDIERLKIPVPSNDILQYFDKSVKPMIERQIKIAKQNNYLTHLRDSLLPMLMNGQVTVE